MRDHEKNAGMPAFFFEAAARRSAHPAAHLVMMMLEVAHAMRVRFGDRRHQHGGGNGGGGQGFQ
jgi:hypothetical protein